MNISKISIYKKIKVRVIIKFLVVCFYYEVFVYIFVISLFG